MSYGWLPTAPAAHVIEGVRFEPVTTRPAEYTFVHAHAGEGWRALDAGAGYVPEWHVLPYILGNMGWTVEAIDHDERSLAMPPHPNVNRKLMNIGSLQYPAETFELICCISVLEHVPEPVRREFGAEVARVATRDARIILTADNYPGITPEVLANLIKEDFDVGERVPDNGSTTFAGGKRVAYVIGTKR